MSETDKNKDDKKDLKDELKKGAKKIKEKAKEIAKDIDKFILGYQKEGLIMLVVSLLSFGFLAALVGLVGIIEGIIYLSKSDEDFFQTYQIGSKPWF